MFLARFKAKNTIHLGSAEEERIKAIEDSFFDPEFTVTDCVFNITQTTLLAPCQPSKIIAVGLNYKDHAKELRMDLPKEPLIFMKPSTSVVGPFGEIVYPEGIGRLDYEAELGIVIKKFCKNVSAEASSDYILGYTCLNDVTARDLQKKDGQWTRAKSFDTFCPIGPFIATEVDPENLDIQLLLNGEVRQSSNTKNLIFSPGYLVSFISKVCALLPGDIIATGTPSGVGPMKVGDEAEVRIQNVGALKNRVVGTR